MQNARAKQEYTDTILPVPFISQRLDISSWNEPHRACGMVSTLMALRYYEQLGLLSEPLPELDLLVARGKEDGGLIEGSGWSHKYLVDTFRTYGIACTREENMDPVEAIPRFAEIIQRCGDPILISTQHIRFGSRDRLTHIVPLTGVRESSLGIEGFFFHDPNVYKRGQGQNEFVSVLDLPQGWRRMALLPCSKM